MFTLQCKLDIQFKLKSIVGVCDFLKCNLRIRNDKKVENHWSMLFRKKEEKAKDWG